MIKENKGIHRMILKKLKQNLIIVILCLSLLFFLGMVYQFQQEDTSQGGGKRKYQRDSSSYDIYVVADKDTDSKVVYSGSKPFWTSVLKSGKLTRDDSGKYFVEWVKDTALSSKYNEDGRGMELSELVYWNGDLLTCDDRTGIIFKIKGDSVVPLYILPKGDGEETSGFKCEWMTVKKSKLIVGSLGKEYTNSKGEITSHSPFYIKRIDKSGNIEHVDWEEVYSIVREELGAPYPGYVIHEAVNWNPIDNKWYFLPRRWSTEEYNDVDDERRGINYVLSFDESFSTATKYKIGEHNPTHGFSSFKFIPGREEEVVALRTVEHGETIETYIMVFNIHTREILMEETKFADAKFEGVEIL